MATCDRRFTELRGFLEAGMKQSAEQDKAAQQALVARLDALENSMRASVEQSGNSLSAYIGELEDRLMPDLRGMSGRQAIEALAPLRVIAHLEGDGFVTRHEPVPGIVVHRGSTARLWMERRRTSAAEVRP